MFKAIRDSFLGLGRRIGGSWRALRAGGAVRLFLFEFTVVLLGVLAAQGLQTWSRERELAAYSAEAISRYEAELATGLETAFLWQAALPCMRERVDAVMRQAGEETFPAELLIRPGLWSSRVTPLSEEVDTQFRRTAGQGRVAVFKDAATHVNRIDRMGEAIAGDWQQFLRIDPDLGPVRESDITAVRNAAAQIHSGLSNIGISVDYLITELAQYGMEPAASVEDGVRRLPLRDCSDFARYGAIHRPEGDRLNSLDRLRGQGAGADDAAPVDEDEREEQDQ